MEENTAAMNAIVKQRCANHAGREAVSKCVECTRFFCRECVTEHGERMLCSACLLRTATGASAARQGGGWLMLAAMGSAGLLLLWTLFYWAGDLLANSR